MSTLPSKTKSDLSPGAFLFLLTLSLIACCIEVDISVPSFPDMARYFDVSEGTIQLTIAYNFLGFCIAGLFYGPLSECYGRRSIMIMGNACLLIGAVGCVYAPTIPWLLTARFIQGVGAATPAVIVFAMIADIYQGEKSAKLIGMMNAILTICMAAAPIAGGFINEAVGWRGSYSIVALLCLISWGALYFLLPETKKDLDVFSLKKIFKDYGQLFTSSKFVSASLVPSLQCSAYLAFVSCGAFLYMETFELPMLTYIFHQMSVIGSFSVMSLLSGKVINKFGARNCVIKGTILCILGSVSLVILSLIDPNSPYLMTSFMILFGIGMASSYPVIFAASLEVFPEIKGAASSAVMAMRAFLISAFVGLISYVYNGQPIRVFSVIFLAVALSVVFTLKFLRTEQVAEAAMV